MKKIGIISDTHSYWDDAYLKHFEPCDEIWHAGDIGSPELAEEIAAFKPLRAVHGNIDGGATRYMFQEFNAFQTEQTSVLMTHIGGYPRHYSPQAIKRIQAVRPKIFVAGHSHILKIIYDPVYELLHINPGAAGRYGFHSVRTAVRFKIDGERIFDMEIGEWPRLKQQNEKP